MTCPAVPRRGPEAGNTHKNIMMEIKEHKNCSTGPEEIAIFMYEVGFSLLMKEQRLRPRRDTPAADQ